MTSRGRPGAGFTLAEVLVAGALGLMLMVLLFQFLVPTMRASVRGATRVELQQMAVIALNKISADLQNTAPAGLSLSTTPPVSMGIVRISTVMGDGRQVWEQKMIVYGLQGDRLIRKEFPPGAASVTFSANAPVRVSASTLAGIAAEVSGKEQTIASGVMLFNVATAGTDGNVSDPVTITLGLKERNREVGEQGQPAETFTLTRTVSMKQRL